jgi:hypothetical protein
MSDTLTLKLTFCIQCIKIGGELETGFLQPPHIRVHKIITTGNNVREKILNSMSKLSFTSGFAYSCGGSRRRQSRQTHRHLLFPSVRATCRQYMK